MKNENIKQTGYCFVDTFGYFNHDARKRGGCSYHAWDSGQPHMAAHSRCFCLYIYCRGHLPRCVQSAGIEKLPVRETVKITFVAANPGRSTLRPYIIQFICGGAVCPQAVFPDLRSHRRCSSRHCKLYRRPYRLFLPDTSPYPRT